MSTHRSTSQYKVKNKPFKGQGNHRSKGAVKRQAAGKTEGEARVSVKAKSQANRKANLRNKKTQELKLQRERERERKKQGQPPRLVVLLALSESANAQLVKSKLANHCAPHSDGVLPVTVTPPRLRKQRFTLLAPNVNRVQEVLEAVLLADIVVPVVDALEGISETGAALASAIKSQGLPAVQPVITGVPQVALKLRHEAKKGLLADLQYLFPNVTRVLPADEGDGDVVQIFRFLDAIRLQDLQYRQARSFVLAERVAFEQQQAAEAMEEGDEAEEPMGRLQVTGYVRGGNGLSADVLLSIPGLGDVQVDRILDADRGTVLHAASEARPSLDAENEPDPFAGGEQTWPTDADVAMAGMDDDDEEDEAVGRRPVIERKVQRRIPAGMNEYQAAWLLDSDGEYDDDEEDEGGEASMQESSEERALVLDDPEGAAGLDGMDDDDDLFLDAAAAKRQAEQDEILWPDEKQVPAEEPARERYQQYRGLESFRTSVWDPKENLPSDYSRIFQLEHYAHFVRRHSRTRVDEVAVGRYVTLEMQCPVSWAQRMRPDRPLVLGSLLKHENKVSVLHFDVMKHADYTEPLASKEELVACFGTRRMLVRPLFSQRVSGCERCKYERFLPSEGATMASFFGPITYTPCTITLWKRDTVTGLLTLAASGTLRSANADTLLIKKIILTAHPSKVHKRTAMCKGMFYNPEDVKWFKPVSLWTKHGRLGHIRESNGTKGDFKAFFDGQLANSDTVCMSLYKRVYPKFQQEHYFE